MKIIATIVAILITIQVFFGHFSTELIVNNSTALWWKALIALSETVFTWFLILIFTFVMTSILQTEG